MPELESNYHVAGTRGGFLPTGLKECSKESGDFQTLVGSWFEVSVIRRGFDPRRVEKEKISRQKRRPYVVFDSSQLKTSRQHFTPR